MFFEQFAELLSRQQDPPADPNDFFASIGSPSASIAVLDRGKIEARCFSNLGNDIGTRFQACSISKAVTGVAVMRLVDRGRLKLEDKIADFLPKAIVDALGRPEFVREVNFSHILSHTAGLTTSGFWGYASDPPSATEVVFGKYPVNSLPVRVVGMPGRQFCYSGGGFVLLQLALEKVTSKPFPKLMQELVLRPLGMDHSCYGNPEGGPGLAPAYETGETPSLHWHYFAELAAAGLWTTPSDLLKVVHAIQTSLKSEHGFLNRETAHKMLTEVHSTMALSWKAPKDPGKWFGHVGANDPGYRCIVMGFADLSGEDKNFPEEGCGFAVMTNSTNGLRAVYTAVQTVGFLKDWPYTTFVSDIRPFEVPLKTVDSVPRGDWRAWQGSWSEGWTLTSAEDRQPRAAWHDLSPIPLLPAAVCSKKCDEGRSIDLVLEDMAGMMRLTWKDGKRIIEYWDCLAYKVTSLTPIADRGKS